VLPQVVGDQRLGALAVLGGDQQLLDLDRAAVAVADRHLRLAVRPQVRHDVGLAHVGQPLGELVRQRDRQRHQLRRLVGRVAEHHALVAGAGEVECIVVRRVRARLVRRVDALRDVGRLLVDGVEDRARVGAEAQVGVDVADLADRLARDVLDVDVGLGRDLARDDDQAGVDEGLAGDAALRVVAQHGVEDAVADLVGHLVGMPLGDGLGREEVLVVGVAHEVKRREISAVDSLSLPDVCAPIARTVARSPLKAWYCCDWPRPVCSPSWSSLLKSRKTSEDTKSG
jgi:hypothetical protein